MKRLCAAGAAFLLVCMGMPLTASAQQGVISLKETIIKGRIQKPEAFYILQHADLDYEDSDVKGSFLTELKESVEEDPF